MYRRFIYSIVIGMLISSLALGAEVRKLGVNDLQYGPDVTSPAGKDVKGIYPIDVRSYGAVGDGVTDDTAAIQAAHDALPAAGGSIILGQSGAVFLISSTINLTKKVYVKGWGRNDNPGVTAPTSIKKSSTLNGTAINVLAARSVLEGFAIEGEPGNGGDGIALFNNGITLRDISVHKMGRDNIRIGDDAGLYNCNTWFLEFVTSDNAVTYGVHVWSVASRNDANAGTAIHVEVRNNGSAGIFDNGSANTWVGTLAETNTGAGFQWGAQSGKGVIVGGDLDEANGGGYDIVIDSGATSNIVLFASVKGSRILDGGTNTQLHYTSGNDASLFQDASYKRFMTRRVQNMDLVNGTNDNVTSPNGSFSRVLGPTTDNWVLCGMTAGQSGQRVVLHNATSKPGIITFDCASSGSGNRILFAGGSSPGDNTTWATNGTLEFIYDDSAAFWYLISRQ